jgi:regulator of sigma E protease
LKVELLLLADMASTMTLIGVILKVALGLGFVIFVHELGHFAVAKACGVKCEKFFLGFDIGGYKISRKWGETEYGIGILPLGGYVKMLGQDDDPAHIAEQLKKSEVAANNPDAVEVTGPSGERYHVDPRSYLAKSVPQRMAIISAGVIMNVIFAFIFAVIAYGIGVPYNPCIVSEAVPGSPAWRAGIEPGDQIVQIGNRINPTFDQLRGGVTLGDLENGIPVVVRRADDGEQVDMTLTPQRDAGLARIGIAPPMSLELWDPPAMEKLPAGVATQIEPPVANEKDKAGFKAGDKIVRINDVAISDYRAFIAELTSHPEVPLRVTVARADDPSAGEDAPTKELTFEVPTLPVQSFGLVMKMGPITAIQANGVGAEAGLKVGDVITAVDGQSIDQAKTASDWSSATFSDKMRQAALAGQSVKLSIARPKDAKSADEKVPAEELEITVTPRVPAEFYASIPPLAPMGVASLGVAYQIDNQVAAITPGSPASKSDIEPGDTIVAAKIILPKKKDGTTPEPKNVRFVEPPAGWLAAFLQNLFGGDTTQEPAQLRNWPMFVNAIQLSPGAKVEFTVESGNEEDQVLLTPAPVDGFYVAERGFNFRPIEMMRRATTFREQVEWGWDTTVESLTMVYRFLQKLGTQIPLTALGGPITIAQAAGYSAYEGVGKLLIFLTMLSANLAVINFLPIPLLDGGHMVFLAYEGLRGRPASERFVVALHTVGFALIVSLMLFVLALDFGLIPRNL